MIVVNDSSNSSHFPYQACLIPNLPEEVQHQVRDITNHVVRPFSVVLNVLSFVFNALVLTAVSRTKSLQHPAMLMLCSLSITDLIWALYILTREIFALFVSDAYLCQPAEIEETSASILCYVATLSNLTLISRDRYQAVCSPHWYRTYSTRSRAIKGAVLSWVASVATALSNYVCFRFSYYIAAFITVIMFYIICITMIIYNYVRVWLGNRLHARRICRNVPNRRSDREKQLTRVVSLIVLCFLFSVLPAVISPLILVAVGFQTLVPFGPFSSLLMTLNGLLNPLLNYGRNKDMRRAVRKMLTCRHQTAPLPPPAQRNT